MQAEKYLKRIKQIDILIANKLEEHKRLVGVAEGLGGFSVGDKVQTSKNLQQIPNAIARYADIEREIDELNRERQAIINTIEKLPAAEYEVIYRLYVQDNSIKEIAYQKGKSYAWVKYIKSNGLKLLQDILDGRECRCKTL